MDKAGVATMPVIGVGCGLLPGGIASPTLLWEAPRRRPCDDLIREMPPERWDEDEYEDPRSRVYLAGAVAGGVFRDDVAVDSEFSGHKVQETF